VPNDLTDSYFAVPLEPEPMPLLELPALPALPPELPELPMPLDGDLAELPPAALPDCLSRQVCFSVPVSAAQSADEELVPPEAELPALPALPPEELLPLGDEPPAEPLAAAPELPPLAPPLEPPLCAHVAAATPNSAAVTAAAISFSFTIRSPLHIYGRELRGRSCKRGAGVGASQTGSSRKRPCALFHASGGTLFARARTMVQHPRWNEMCARILQQCEYLRGSKDSLAHFLAVDEAELESWLAAKSGPPRSVFEKAMELILAEHERRSSLEVKAPRRRRTDH